MSSSHHPDTEQDGHIGAGWYAAALVVYIAIGYVTKSVLLNWIMGPLFLLVTLYIIPTVVRGLYTKARARSVE